MIVAGFWLGAVVPGILAVVPIFRKSRRPITKAARCPDPISKNGNSTPIGRSSSRTSCWEPASGFVIHHTNCGMELFTDDVIGDFLADSLETAKFDGKAWSNPKHGHGASAGQFIKWHTIKDQASSVVQDVRRIREHPLVAKDIPIYGYIYDVHSGNLIEVTEATEAGRLR